MSRIVLKFSISLDGYAAGPDISLAEGMGVGGERLHEWMFDGSAQPAPDPAPGAIVLGRRTFDVGLRHWNDTPYPAPSFVVTHRPEPVRQMTSAAFTFVTAGVADAIDRAKAAADGKDVIVMGVSIAQQALAAGLVDDLRLQIVPVLLGNGTRLLEHTGPVELALTRLREAPGVTHFDFSISRQEF